MAPGQLKQLKAALRDHGVLGPQKSKKVRKVNAKDGQKRLQRNTALTNIRERFNPFEVKAPARKDKFDIATNKPTKTAIGRPGVTRGLGEERRRETLLKEMQSRNKVGGMTDRRFGENDPTMTPEERAAERFARQALRTSKKNSMFNLEDDSDEEMTLTHGGRSLDFNDQMKDDFQDDDISGSEQDDLDDRPSKRLRFDDNANLKEGVEGEEVPERRKTKQEVMKEIIAKSKMHKAERQAAKEDDDDLRRELDRGMGEFYEALRNQKLPEKQLPSPPHTDTEPLMDPGRAAMLAGKSREEAEREYEANLRMLQMEARSKPSTRTKTEEEIAADKAARLQELERKRLRRMRGEVESSDEEDLEDMDETGEQDEQGDNEVFGLNQPEYPPRPQLDVEDEDDFVLDDIVASDSNAELSEDGSEEEDLDDSDDSEMELEDDGDDGLINGLDLPKTGDTRTKSTPVVLDGQSLAYTFSCPQTHEELLAITKATKIQDLPTVVQRIRALYHKGLAEENQDKLDRFAGALLEHVAYLADSDIKELPYSVLESLLRHLHSMAKAQPAAISTAFRKHLRCIAEQRPLDLTAGDLIVLTGISTIFPTSDHFHAVTTPAMLTIARYLGQSSVQSLSDLTIGAYACTLALQYQKFSERFVPELCTYIVNALAVLAPVPWSGKNAAKQSLSVPLRLPGQSLRLTKSSATTTSKLSFDILRPVTGKHPEQANILKSFITIINQATNLWQTKTAFPEFASPIQQLITHLLHPDCKNSIPKDLQALLKQTSTTLSEKLQHSITTRKPLLLHNHRPLAIKSSIPQFIENYNPSRHHDPDRERAELAKLKAEHKQERKGAMRELRKDANFIAREQLREKKAKDEAYEKKFKRLVAEIQGEEGKEAKEYEREKSKRKGNSKGRF